ncbi:3-dehydroquinate synthase [Antarcticibacterium flavum]|uniref:3-dehydroquinate synthase n=1 Tax=Antarcticibacterium flavum TaxID=2058175 RepID=A0A5B7WZZ5_9FLAO|nr:MULTISPECIES: 3-dehydroquinate synthase [Antarcticibacterium]MCM4160294.1 3-dehydroquinate synthase [Antarcticibacterium sp. W02-3]QCY67931.1 3-dehydroquinate synthase [Antarcticibacterium flavum]
MTLDAQLAPVFYSEDGYAQLNNFLSSKSPSIIFILVDSNTRELCLTRLLQKLETTCVTEVIEMEEGEQNKNIETCTGIWEALSELGADRKALLINLGGGVVTDLGGFVASTFKRGIDYINIPTTLLSMVDASVGGKTGVDLGNLKNQIGVISQPEMVIINTTFLETLPAVEMRSGLAEILKHGLIASRDYWHKANDLGKLTLDDLESIIAESVEIKTTIVKKDPREENLRKTLNFGHTFGHAIESFYLDHPHKKRLLHGEAVAAGMIIAAYISNHLTSLPQEDLEEITNNLLNSYPVSNMEREDYEPIMELMKFDKKNSHGKIKFVLLEKIGKAVIDCEVPQQLQTEALEYYNNLKKKE